MTETTLVKNLLDTLPQIGQVEWIGIRPSKDQPMESLTEVQILLENGVEGDRFRGKAGSPRQVTLIQKEHLAAVAGFLGREQPIQPEILRRNIVVSGLNLQALKGKQFQIGEVILEHTGLAHPCSKMEAALGPGGYNAMRGHGGITARVIQPGIVRLNDSVLYQS